MRIMLEMIRGWNTSRKEEAKEGTGKQSAMQKPFLFCRFLSAQTPYKSKPVSIPHLSLWYEDSDHLQNLHILSLSSHLSPSISIYPTPSQDPFKLALL